MSVKKKRIYVALSKDYLDGIDHLKRKGVYLRRSSAIRAGLRLLFKAHGISHYLMEAEG